MNKIIRHVSLTLMVILGNVLYYGTMPLLYAEVHPYIYAIGTKIMFFIIISLIFIYFEFFKHIINKPSIKTSWKFIIKVSLMNFMYSALFFNNINLNKTPLYLVLFLFGFQVVYAILIKKLITKLYKRREKNIIGMESLGALFLLIISFLFLSLPLFNYALKNYVFHDPGMLLISLLFSIVGNFCYAYLNITQQSFIHKRKIDSWNTHRSKPYMYYDIFYIIFWSTLLEIILLLMGIFLNLIPQFGTVNNVDELHTEINRNILCFLNLDCHDKYIYIYTIINCIGYMLSYISHIFLNKSSVYYSLLLNSVSIPIILLVIKNVPLVEIKEINIINYFSIIISIIICFISILLWKYAEEKNKVSTINSYGTF